MSGLGSKVSGGQTTSVLIVGPVSPFRSSIATHMTALAEELGSMTDVKVLVISFKTLYPSWLFPGESDLGSADSVACEQETDYSLSSVNPLSWIGAVRRARDLEPDIVILPLWSFFPAICLGWIASQCRKHGLRVTTVVHNVTDHEKGRIKSLLLHYQARASDKYLVHSKATAARLSTLFSTASYAIHPLPIGRGYPIQLDDSLIGVDRDPPKTEPGKNVLFFGLIRAYKGLDIALEAIALTKNESITLTVAGEAWLNLKDIEAHIEQLGITDRVTLIPKYVDDKQAEGLFRNCDLVVLPYRAISSSGVLPLAYAFGKPVVASNLPGLVEQIEHGSTGWIAPEYSPHSFAKTIEEGLLVANSEKIKSAIERKAAAMTWRTYAESILALNSDPTTVHPQ